MFAELMAFFSSLRCFNCRGGSNPHININHPGGQQVVPDDGSGNMTLETGKSAECLTCHTAAPDEFRLAPKDMSFVGKDTLSLCHQLRNRNALAFADAR